MIGGVDLIGHECTPRRSLAGRGGTERQHARQLHFKLDVAILVEVPEKPILVILHRRHRRHDQPPRPPHLGLPQPAVGVLPEDAEILLVHADRVLHQERLASAGREVRVEIADQPQAIAAQLEAVGAHPHPVFTDVEGVLAALRLSWVAIGHHHLRQRRPIEDGAVFVAIAVAEVVERQPLAGIEPDHELPILPSDLIALDGKARALRLGDLQRLDVAALVGDAIGGVVARARRQRPLSDIRRPPWTSITCWADETSRKAPVV